MMWQALERLIKSQRFRFYIYIDEKKPLHILEKYGLKKVYNLNRIIAIVFNYICAYAQDYTLLSKT